jgi:hypothetical protein
MPRIESAPDRHRSHGFIFFFIAFDARGFTAEKQRAQRVLKMGRRIGMHHRAGGSRTAGENTEIVI